MVEKKKSEKVFGNLNLNGEGEKNLIYTKVFL